MDRYHYGGKIKNENVHNVLENHTYSNRLKEIIDTVDLNYIPVVIVTNDGLLIDKEGISEIEDFP